MPRKAERYILLAHRWMDILLFAVALAMIAILLTASTYSRNCERPFQESGSIQSAITPCGNSSTDDTSAG